MRELLDINSNAEDTVAVSNDFALSKKNALGPVATNLLAWAISQIKTTDTSLVSFKLTPDGFAKAFGSKNPRRDLARVTAELRQFEVKAKNEEGIEEDFAVVPGRSYDPSTGEYILEFHTRMHKHLLVNKDFCAEKLQVFTSASCQYSFPFYNLLLAKLRGAPSGDFDLDIMMIRYTIGATAKSYDKYAEFERRVLRLMKKEFDIISDLKFTWTKGRKGYKGRIESVVISVTRGSSQQALLTISPLVRSEKLSPIAPSLQPLLKDFGFSNGEVAKLREVHSDADIEANLLYTASKPDVENKKRYALKSIKGGFAQEQQLEQVQKLETIAAVEVDKQLEIEKTRLSNIKIEASKKYSKKRKEIVSGFWKSLSQERKDIFMAENPRDSELSSIGYEKTHTDKIFASFYQDLETYLPMTEEAYLKEVLSQNVENP